MNRKMRANLAKSERRETTRRREKSNDARGTGINCSGCGEELKVGDVVTFEAEVVESPEPRTLN